VVQPLLPLTQDRPKTMLEVKGLVDRGAVVEIEATAVIPDPA